MFALTSNNEIIHIKDVISKKDYFCANCGGILRVRNGKIKIKHFYHLNNDCGDRGESLIHRYWKEYFFNLKEFEGFKIIDSKMEVALLDNKYIPDIVFKIDNKNYIIIEICYKNPKTFDYLQKFRKLTKLKKVYEIKVELDKIIEIKEIYDRENFEKEYKEAKEKLELAKQTLLKFSEIGGIKYCILDHYPSFIPVIDKYLRMDYRWYYNKSTGNGYSYPYKDSVIATKSIISLSMRTKTYRQSIVISPFSINIYNKKEAMGDYAFGELCIKNSELNVGLSVKILK